LEQKIGTAQVLDFKEENTTFDLKIPKFQLLKIGQPVGRNNL
jgi:hypothetical protein